MLQCRRLKGNCFSLPAAETDLTKPGPSPGAGPKQAATGPGPAAPQRRQAPVKVRGLHRLHPGTSAQSTSRPTRLVTFVRRSLVWCKLELSCFFLFCFLLFVLVQDTAWQGELALQVLRHCTSFIRVGRKAGRPPGKGWRLRRKQRRSARASRGHPAEGRPRVPAGPCRAPMRDGGGDSRPQRYPVTRP